MNQMTASPEKGGNNPRGFTLELKSRGQVKSVAVPNGAKGVLIEGNLGTLKHAKFIDGVVLEVTGKNGVLRVDLAREELSHTRGGPERDEREEGSE
jgi:hypothetical protein